MTSDAIPTTLSADLREQLRDRGWTISRLCRESGMTYGAVHPMVNGRAPLSARLCASLESLGFEGMRLYLLQSIAAYQVAFADLERERSQ